MLLFVCLFFGRSFVVRIKYVNRSSREPEYVYWFLHGETAIYRRLCILMSSDGRMDKNRFLVPINLNGLMFLAQEISLLLPVLKI